MKDTEPHVQPFFHGSYLETGMGPQGSAGVGFSVYTPTPDIIRLFLFTLTMQTSEERYKKYGPGSQRNYPNQEFVRFISRNYFKIPFEERKAIKVLEIGVGAAGNLWFVAKEGFDAYGLDEAETGVKLGHEVLAKWGTEANLFVGDMRHLPFDDGMFDVIYDVASLQHVSDKAQVLKEVYRCLKPGGRFYSYHLHTDTTLVFGSDPYMALTSDQWKHFLSEAHLKVTYIEQFTRNTEGTGIASYIGVEAQK